MQDDELVVDGLPDPVYGCLDLGPGPLSTLGDIDCGGVVGYEGSPATVSGVTSTGRAF